MQSHDPPTTDRSWHVPTSNATHQLQHVCTHHHSRHVQHNIQHNQHATSTRDHGYIPPDYRNDNQLVPTHWYISAFSLIIAPLSSIFNHSLIALLSSPLPATSQLILTLLVFLVRLASFLSFICVASCPIFLMPHLPRYPSPLLNVAVRRNSMG